MKIVKMIGRYKIVKRYDRAYRRFFYDIYRESSLLFTYPGYNDSERALQSWIEVNGKY